MKPLIVPFFLAHRGCPHRCVFCDQVKIAGHADEFPTAAEILATIAHYRRTAGRNRVEVAFYGGTFTALPREAQERLLLPLQPLLAAGDLLGVRVSTRPDAVDAGIAAFLAERGVRTVELGVQSMDDSVLESAGRGHTAGAVKDACRALKEAGLQVGIQLMPGLPGDSPERSLDSLTGALSLRPDFLRIYPALVISGTRLEALYRQGDYVPLTVPDAVQLCKLMLHEALCAAVPVIRIGLQPTASLESVGTIIAGPYHPAFRQLVETEICYDLLVLLMGGVPHGEPLTIRCAPGREADVAGHRRANVRRLFLQQGVKISAIAADPSLSHTELRVEWGTGDRKGDMLQDLRYTTGGTAFA
jgi:histone acetyltransferase (RNA polymerase elongator complex component)